MSHKVIMKLKHSVKLNGIKPEIIIAMIIADGVYQAYDSELVITSVCDGKHGKGSLHYPGLAFDCRIRNLDPKILTAPMKEQEHN